MCLPGMLWGAPSGRVPGVVHLQDPAVLHPRVLLGRVEADLVAVRVVQERQDPTDGRRVHTGMALGELAQPLGESLESGAIGNAHREEVEVAERRRTLGI